MFMCCSATSVIFTLHLITQLTETLLINVRQKPPRAKKKARKINTCKQVSTIVNNHSFKRN